MSTSSKPRTRVWLLGLCAALLVAFSAAPAAAQNAKQKAKELYHQGKTQFDLGNFEDAVKLFKEAYATSPYPAFLFNIAQAYRQMGDCRQALFFYKRYLTVSGGNAPNKELVDGHIRELSETCKASEDMKNKPPLGAMSPGEDGADTGDTDGSTDVAAAGDDDDDSDIYEDDSAGSVTTTRQRKDPTLISTSIAAGPAFLDLGDLEISGAQFSLSLGAGYPLNFGKIGLTLGAMFTYTPVLWNNGDISGNSPLISALASVGAHYWALDKLAVRADVGAGGMFVGGLSDPGNVFLPPGTTADGLLGTFNFRVGIGADYLVTPNLKVSVSPFVFSMSPAPADFRMGIDSITRIELAVGLGYQL